MRADRLAQFRPIDLSRGFKVLSDHMKALYAMLLRECSARDFSAQPKASPAEVAAVEARLGVRLPESYREFALDVGSVFWPVQVFSLAELEHHGRFEQPAWFLPFASDCSINAMKVSSRVGSGRASDFTLSFKSSGAPEAIMRPR